MKTWFDKNYTITYPHIVGEPKDIYYPCACEGKLDGELDFVICDNGNFEMVNKDKYGNHRIDLPVLDEIKSLGLNQHIIAGELYMRRGEGAIYDFLRNRKNDALKFGVFGIYEFIKSGSYYKPKDRVKNCDMRTELETLFANKNFKSTHLIEREIAKDYQDLIRIKDNFVAKGYEGIVAKNLNSLWCNGDTREWGKFKRENSADLVILGYGKKAKYLSLYLGYKDNGLFKSIGNCGSFKKDKKDKESVYTKRIRIKALLEQDRLSNQEQSNRDNILVMPKFIVEIDYQEVIKDRQGNITSLRHPVFKRIRHDKTINEVSWK